MYFKYSGLNIYYEKKGTGSPIIFLHGWGCTGDIFTNITKDLYNNYEVYLIDLPTFGKSINDSVIFSINDYSNFLYSFIGELKIDNPILVGHSFGGRILIEYTSKYNNYNKLILIDSAGIKRFSIKKKIKILIYKCKKKYFKLTKQLMKYEYLISNSGSDDYKNSTNIQKEIMKNAVNYNQRKLLKKITKETLIIWGAIDKMTPLKDAKVFKKLIKNSELIIIPKTKHFPFLEEPIYFKTILNNYLGV